MEDTNQSAGGPSALPRSRSVQNGIGLGALLFGFLMLPSYGAGDIETFGHPTWQVVGLGGLAYLAAAYSGLKLAKKGWKPRWQWIAVALLVAAAALLVPLVLPIGSPSFIWVALVAMVVFGFAVGFAQLHEQTTAVASADKEHRSKAVAEIMSYHLVAGVILGLTPFFSSWQVGQVVLAATLVGLAAWVAVRRRAPEPGPSEPWSLRRLFRETGPGSLIVATGMAAWTGMYFLPGVHGVEAWVLAVYAGFAQLLAIGALILQGGIADNNQPLTAKISGTALLMAFLGVAALPAITPIGGWASAGFWVVLAFFIAGEISANIFITAIEGHLSLEIGGRRAQLVGQSTKYMAVGVGNVLIAGLAGILKEHFDGAQSAIMLGGIMVAAFSLMFLVGFYLLHRRHQRLV